MGDPTADLGAVLALPFVVDAGVADTMFHLTFKDEATTAVDVVLPPDYPTGEACLMDDRGMTPLRAGRLVDIAAQVWETISGGDRGEGRTSDVEVLSPQTSGVSTASSDALEDVSDRMMSEDPADRDLGYNDALQRDVELAGSSVVGVKHFLDSDEVYVSLRVDLALALDEMVALAWGLDVDVPLVLTLVLSRSSYLHSTLPPRVECQLEGGGACQLAAQLTNIMTIFFRNMWLHGGDTVAAVAAATLLSPDNPSPDVAGHGNRKIPKGTAAPVKPPGKGAKAKPKPAGRGYTGAVVRPSSGPRGPAPKPAPAEPSDKDKEKWMNELVSMGFVADDAMTAIAVSDSLEAATHLLLTGESLKTDHSHQHQRKPQLPHTTGAGSFTGALVPPGVPEPQLDKAFPPEGPDGFLIRVVQYALLRIPTCALYCVICDQSHKYGGSMKPSVCLRDLCLFAFRELNVGREAADDIATPEYLGRLVNLLALAAPTVASNFDLSEATQAFMQNLPQRLEHGETWEVPVPTGSPFERFLHQVREHVGKKGAGAGYYGGQAMVTKNVRILILPKHTELFWSKMEEFERDGKPHTPVPAWHSTPHKDAVKGIMTNNFDPNKCGRHDAGYYGKGTYFHTNTPFGGAGGVDTFFSLLLKGREYELTYRLGCPLQPGYDSHIAADRKQTGETVIFKQAQMLPLFIFDSQ